MFAIEHDTAQRDDAASLPCGRWHESSAELRRGLEVIELHWPRDADDLELLADLVSFE